jgi:transglutaminase-like putative cysteine protease
MSLGQVALGLASIALGVNQIRSGARRIGGARARGRQQLAGLERVGQLGKPLHRQGSSHERTLAGPMRLRTYQINTLEDRIAHLRQLVQAGKRDPAVYAFTRKAVTARCGDNWCVPEKNNAAEVKALFDAIRRNVRYTSDIAGADTYQSPGKTLKLRAGDCDDYASLVCAAAHQLGIPCRFAVIRTKGANDWNHIYAQVGLPRRRPTKWISMDASVSMPCGWEAPAGMVAAKRVFPT